MKICANGVNLYFDVDGLGLVHQGSAMRQRPTVVALHGGPGIEEPVVIGASFGGFVAQAYATRYPEHVGKLVLAGTTARFHAEQAFSMFAKLGGPEAEAVARRFFADCSGDVFQEYLETCMPL